MLRAFFVTFVTFVYILVAGTPLLIYTWISGNPEPIYRVGKWGTMLALWLGGVRLDVRGAEKIPRDRAVIFMPNHQSNCDPPALVAVLPRVRIIAKQEFFRVPVLGPGMRACGFIPLDRKHRERAIAAVERAVEALKAGHSFLAYPEGTRSPDGRLQSFKKGLFVMAIKAGASVVPISVSGARKIMPKGKPAIRPGRIRITIHDPIPTTGFTVDHRQALADLTRKALLAGLEPEEWPAGLNSDGKEGRRDSSKAEAGPLL